MRGRHLTCCQIMEEERRVGNWLRGAEMRDDLNRKLNCEYIVLDHLPCADIVRLRSCVSNQLSRER